VIPMSPLRLLELPTKSQLQAVSLSTTFLTLLALTSFLAEAKRTFTNFLTVHHNLGSSRAMPNRLGGFTSKSNKYHEDCFTKLKCSNTQITHKEESLTLSLDLSQITQTSQKMLGRAHKGFRMSIFVGGISNLQRWEGKAFILVPKNLVIGN
jgi:hypothetical protein